MTDQLLDGRKLPIFIHSVIDDMTGLTPNAMRVYMHLARRANKSGVAWPSYQSIGDHCFSSISDNQATRRSFARRAVDELIAARLIVKTNRSADGAPTSNAYQLIDPPQGGMPIGTPMPIGTGYAYRQGGMPIGTKDTPIEDTPMNKPAAPESTQPEAETPLATRVWGRLEKQWLTVNKTQADQHTRLAEHYGFDAWLAGFEATKNGSRSNAGYVEKVIQSELDKRAAANGNGGGDWTQLNDNLPDYMRG